MVRSLKIWGARSNAARRRCRRRLLICQNLGGHVPPLPPLWTMPGVIRTQPLSVLKLFLLYEKNDFEEKKFNERVVECTIFFA